MNDLDRSSSEIDTVLKLNSKNTYAYIFSAGMINNEDKLIYYLSSVLQIQPNNFRALRELGYYYLKNNIMKNAIYYFQFIIKLNPFVESRYGIMNEYMNDVMTGANNKDSYRKEVKIHLDKLDSI